MDDDETTTINCQTRTFSVDVSKIERLARFVCEQLGVAHHELSITFVDPDEMRILNRDYRGKDRSTDVLSFPQQVWDAPLQVSPLSEPAAGPVSTPSLSDTAHQPPRGAASAPPPVLGDIVISLGDAQSNAQRINQPLEQEVAFLLVHGILHLCGHDHQTPEEEQSMLAQQRMLMKLLESPEVPLWTSAVKATENESRVH